MKSLLLFLILASAAPAANRALLDFRAARRAEKAGDTLQAYLLSARAAALDARNPQYAAYKNALQTRAAMALQAQVEPAVPSPPPLAQSLAALDLTPSEMAEAAAAIEPPRLRPSSQRKSFDIRGDARMVFEQVASAYGIQVTFDGDFQSVPPFLFRMDNLTQ